MSDDWRPGDLAYCTDARRARGFLEKGRMYTVVSVIPMPNHVHGGVALAETSPPEPSEGFWSTRFIRIVRGRSHLRQIDSAIT